jgi:hypothetical protein
MNSTYTHCFEHLVLLANQIEFLLEACLLVFPAFPQIVVHFVRNMQVPNHSVRFCLPLHSQNRLAKIEKRTFIVP